MEFPQSYCKTMLKYLDVINKYGCLAMCYLYCMGIAPKNMIEILVDILEKNKPQETGLDADCTVLDAPKFIFYVSGRKVNVFKENPSLNEIKVPTPVRFSIDNINHSHWVVVQKGKIVFNSLDYSNCVNNGRPIAFIDSPYARVIELK